MEMERLRSGTVALETMVVVAALIAQKSLSWLLFAFGSLPIDIDLFMDALRADKRFPLVMVMEKDSILAREISVLWVDNGLK
ncbi:hypothetical protein LOK49_LG14G01689 [Camellia lanceoleosa]|uniref:Uncharacterized protein n=1 Tax=Camellia lanceoleosa TaxID=1840588 RepID=A0ACC0FEF3_9ERIC|nr:hypothetical protein LOK49_LG14G01689 [Camellia lanceoleosa]